MFPRALEAASINGLDGSGGIGSLVDEYCFHRPIPASPDETPEDERESSG